MVTLHPRNLDRFRQDLMFQTRAVFSIDPFDDGSTDDNSASEADHLPNHQRDDRLSDSDNYRRRSWQLSPIYSRRSQSRTTRPLVHSSSSSPSPSASRDRTRSWSRSQSRTIPSFRLSSQSLSSSRAPTPPPRPTLNGADFEHEEFGFRAGSPGMPDHLCSGRKESCIPYICRRCGAFLYTPEDGIVNFATFFLAFIHLQVPISETMLAAVSAPICLFAAFLLLLLISLSVPVIKFIDLLKLSATLKKGIGIANVSANGAVKFGVWGYCISSVETKVLGQVVAGASGKCSKAHLGYTLDSTVTNALGIGKISNTLSRSLTAVLVLHPITCGLTFVMLVVSLFLLARPTPRRLCAGLSLSVSILAAAVTTAVFLIDVIFVAVVRDKLDKQTKGGVKATWGNATWMMLAATILLWASCVSSCYTTVVWGNRRRKQGLRVY
ncbi:hypothetical protein EW145_g6820 [Phellinidium pouzarii]|uniref:Pali-domain-containing protein n=1 Tax=Phellinidium pouzarii TaxID=167371 RepID=A0A4S4KTJ4_9AGAM|nr:hypothetical protein EW145_g6820 [Phellinidium pouzarii]